MPERTKGSRDKPFRPPDTQDPKYDEAVRQALVRSNERIDALLSRLEHVEQILKDNSLWVDP